MHGARLGGAGLVAGCCAQPDESRRTKPTEGGTSMFVGIEALGLPVGLLVALVVGLLLIQVTARPDRRGR